MIRVFISFVFIIGVFPSTNAQDSLENSVIDTLCFEPSPYIQENDTNRIGIQFCNVPDGTIIEVLSFSGTLIRELIKEDSKPLIWDLRDNYNEEVFNGMYIFKWQVPDKKVRMDRVLCIMEKYDGILELKQLPK